MKKIIPTRNFIIFKDKHYNTFPSIIRKNDGEFMLCFRQAPDWQHLYGKVTHVDPGSMAVYLTSRDGENWNDSPEVLYDDYLFGVQDPCLNTLKDGSLFCTFFMWKVYLRSELEDKNGHQVYDKWVGKFDKLYSIISKDGGRTWSRPVPIADKYGGALRGVCTELDDGAILAPVYANINGSGMLMIFRTYDQGQNWEKIAMVESEDYHLGETSLLKTKSGKIVAFIRTVIKNKEPGKEDFYSPLLTSESLDNGITWSTPTKREFYSSSPFHPLQLDNGQVFISFGYRIKPFGIRAFLLDEECVDFDKAEETVLRDDGLGFDIGYTSAVQLPGGKVLVVYYYYDTVNGPRYIAGTICEIRG